MNQRTARTGASNIDSLHRKWSSDQNYRTAYEEMVPEFVLARSIISSRTAAGLTQAQLAERMNAYAVSHRSIGGRAHVSVHQDVGAGVTGHGYSPQDQLRAATERPGLTYGRWAGRRNGGDRVDAGAQDSPRVSFPAPGCSPWCRGRALPPFKRRLLGQFIGAGGHEVRLSLTQAHSMATSRSVQLAPRLAVTHQYTARATPMARQSVVTNPSVTAS